MDELLEQFHTQFSFSADIVFRERLPRVQSFVVGGMGGSHSSADIIQAYDPHRDIVIHRNYGMPIVQGATERLFIASSYSGNTEETIDFAQEVLHRDLPLAIITSGGALLELARSRQIPHVVLPQGFVPRLAIGVMSRGLATLMHDGRLLDALSKLHDVNFHAHKQEGELRADSVAHGAIIYASSAHAAVAEQWKGALNETAKVPAFWNVFPEAAHNEVEMFEGGHDMPQIPVVLLRSEHDHARVTERMDMFARALHTRKVVVHSVPLAGETFLERTFGAIVLGHWAAFFVARRAGRDPKRVELIESLKRRDAR